MPLLSYEEALGMPAAAPGKPAAAGSKLIPYEEATGQVQQPSLGGFFKDPQARTDMLHGAAGIGDLILGMPAFVAQVGATGVADLYHAATGSRTPLKDANAQMAKVMETPWMKFMLTPLQSTLGVTEEQAADTTVGKALGGISGAIERAAEYWSEKTGSKETGEALKQATQIAMAKGGDTFVKGFREWAAKKKVLPPAAEAAKPAVAPSEAAKTVDAYTEEVLRGKPQAAEPVAPKETVAPAGAAPEVAKPGELGAKPVETPAAEAPASDLDPYKIPAIAGLTGAAAWALQDQLTDEQLAGLGLAAGAATVKLHGVPEGRLIEMLKAGGEMRESAAAQIYRDNVPMLTRSLRKYERQGVLIEDAVQRTMEKGLRDIESGKFRGDSAIQTYLYRIAENEAQGGLASNGLRAQRARIETESLDLGETPGTGKGDEARPSPHENIADESVTGLSPERLALNKALGEKMAGALDKLPENFRRPFEMRELEGMEYAEIAEVLGQPIGTVRSQISRAKEALQKSLREYGPRAAGVGLLAYGASQMTPEEAAAAGLGGAAAMGAIKAKGGMWHSNAKEIGNLMGESLGALKPGDFADIQTNRMVEGYLNKHAGTATDPLKDVVLPSGKHWEEVTDAAIKPVSAPERAWMRGLKEGEQAYDIPYGESARSELSSYLQHVGDYLQAHVPPEKLPQYDLVRAVKETAKWDAEMAKAAEKARAKENDVALKRMESMETVMDFPGTGMKLVKLDKPGDFAHESTVMGHSVRGYEPHKGLSVKELREADPYGDATEGEMLNGVQGHPDWIPESEKGARDSQFSSGHPDYGLGGWEAIKRGDAEILSLRDAKGGSHVTIEISSPYKNGGSAEGLLGFWDAAHKGQLPEITQIRGRGNAPVPERYQQQLADFLNSREWGDVGDTANAGITDLSKLAQLPEATTWTNKAAEVFPRRRFLTEAEHGEVNERLNPPNSGQLSYQPLSGQAGFATPAQLFTLAAATAGGSLGAYLDEESPLRAGIYGALAGGFLGSSKGRAVLKQAIKSPDEFLGLISTRLGNIAPELKGRVRDHERRVLKALDTTHDQVTPFLEALRKQPSGVQEIVARDLMNGEQGTIKATPALAKTYPAVQATLKNLEGQLKGLGRFAEGVGEYFPRIVKDYEGLKNELGKLDPSIAKGLEKALVTATADMMRKENRVLTEVEQSVITNRYLFKQAPTSGLPGFAHSRGIKEVTERLQPFYESPTESLLRYVSGAVTDIEAARFFGRDIKVNSKGERKFTNIDDSIGNLTSRLLEEGKINTKQAAEVRDILQARFGGGEKGMNQGLAMVRDATNAALLGNVTAAATQIGDSLATIYHFGLTPTLVGLTEKLTGGSKVTPKDLGLINHVAEELAGKSVASNVLQKSLKYTGFTAIDMFAKGLSINAALAKARGMAKTPAGQVKLAEKYGYAFEGEMPQLIADLRAGANTKLTQTLAFETLSDIQPISRAELPQAYLEHPNGRLLYQLKTYMLKQGDILRRDAYENIASGKPKQMMTGWKNLAALATLYAFSNVPGDVVKDWLSGREVDPLSTPKLVENVLQTFGLNRYATDRLSQGKVVDTAIGAATPPLKVLEDIAAGRDAAIKYLPGAGRVIYDRYFHGNEKREIAEKRLANKGLPKGEGAQLSDEAKAYLQELRDKRKEKASQ